MRNLMEEIRKRKDDGLLLNPLDVSQVAWAMAKVQLECKPSLQMLQDDLSLQLKNCDARHLSNTLWSFAKLIYVDSPFFELAATAALQQKCGTQELANCAWALATALHRAEVVENFLRQAKASHWRFLSGSLPSRVICGPQNLIRSWNHAWMIGYDLINLQLIYYILLGFAAVCFSLNLIDLFLHDSRSNASYLFFILIYHRLSYLPSDEKTLGGRANEPPAAGEFALVGGAGLVWAATVRGVVRWVLGGIVGLWEVG